MKVLPIVLLILLFGMTCVRAQGTIADFNAFIADNLLIDGDVNYFSALTEIGQPNFDMDENGLSVKQATSINIGTIALSTTSLVEREGGYLNNGAYTGAKLIERVGDIDIAINEGLYGVIFYSHTPPIISPDLSELAYWHEIGLRILHLFDGSGIPVESALTDENGLTNHGRAVVERCMELGILVDVSHSSEAVTLDAAAIAAVAGIPISANHAPAYALRPNGDDRFDRGKTDAELMAIADSGGVIGILAFGPWLQQEVSPATIDDFIDHLLYVVGVVGIDHVGLSTDARIDGQWNDDASGNPRVSGDGLLDSPSRWKEILLKLYTTHEFSLQELRKIMGLNFYRVYRNAWRQTTYDSWSATVFEDPELPEASREGDPDGDKVLNLLEYAAGSDPVGIQDSSSKPLVIREGGGRRYLRFPRDPNLSDIQYQIQFSSDLLLWDSLYDSLAPSEGLEVNNAGTHMDLDISESETPFFRLSIDEL
jgi:microsomal dipeptidase-like Zn-dependent dipeptidase